MKIDTLDAISPIDGRYRKKVEPLAAIMSERGLIKRRAYVECRYLYILAEVPSVEQLRSLSRREIAFLKRLPERVSRKAFVVKEYEEVGRNGTQPTNHDVSALVSYLKELWAKTSLADIAGWIHLLLTSEDVNNIAYALQLRDALELVIGPTLHTLDTALLGPAADYRFLAMLARTHGQGASPTTLGKEFLVFAKRLEDQTRTLINRRILVKFNGATGNCNAHVAAFPTVNWTSFGRNFIGNFNDEVHSVEFVQNSVTTQIEPHDTYAELFDNLRRVNVILIAFCQDIWRYVSDNWLVQRAVEGEHGSSAMPNKVNPIKFENAEGNLYVANGLCEVFSDILPISRLQRHLSDSTIIRNFGVALAHSLVAYRSIIDGLKLVAPNEREIKRALQNHPEVITEAIQIVLRREGVPDAYDRLRELTRGKRVTLTLLQRFIKGLKMKSSVKRELLRLRPETYVGLAGSEMMDNFWISS